MIQIQTLTRESQNELEKRVPFTLKTKAPSHLRAALPLRLGRSVVQKKRWTARRSLMCYHTWYHAQHIQQAGVPRDGFEVGVATFTHRPVSALQVFGNAAHIRSCRMFTITVAPRKLRGSGLNSSLRPGSPFKAWESCRSSTTEPSSKLITYSPVAL